MKIKIWEIGACQFAGMLRKFSQIVCHVYLLTVSNNDAGQAQV